MTQLTTYKGLDVLARPGDTPPPGEGGRAINDDLSLLADRAPMVSDSADPAGADGADEGFFAGSQWLNQNTQRMWVCTNAPQGDDAAWKSFYERDDDALYVCPAGDGGLVVGTDVQLVPSARINVLGTGTLNFRGLALFNRLDNGWNKGAMAIVGPRRDNSNVPFCGFGTWDNGDTRSLWIGGRNWSMPDANDIRFHTAPFDEYGNYTEATNEGQLRMQVSPNGDVAIGSLGTWFDDTESRLHIRTATDEGRRALTLEQQDEVEPFVDFVGTSEAGASKSISSWTAGNSIQGFVKVEINGTARWMPFYNDPTGN